LQILSKIADWSSIAGIVIGIAGLVYSILAFRAAKKAKQSADDARRDVRTLLAADRFHHLSSKAKELISHVELDNSTVAIFLARDLMFEINNAIARWEFLDLETKARFREASQLARQIGEFVRSKGQLDLKDKAKVLKKCDLILSVLSRESGKIQSELEVRSES
jgi:NH3-dependent NAD+ synthetase